MYYITFSANKILVENEIYNIWKKFYTWRKFYKGKMLYKTFWENFIFEENFTNGKCDIKHSEKSLNGEGNEKKN